MIYLNFIYLGASPISFFVYLGLLAFVYLFLVYFPYLLAFAYIPSLCLSSLISRYLPCLISLFLVLDVRFALRGRYGGGTQCVCRA